MMDSVISPTCSGREESYHILLRGLLATVGERAEDYFSLMVLATAPTSGLSKRTKNGSNGVASSGSCTHFDSVQRWVP